MLSSTPVRQKDIFISNSFSYKKYIFVFADFAPQNGICFIIQDGDNNDSGASVSPLSTPSIIGGSFLSVSSGSSDCEARPVKRKRSDEEASQSSSARDEHFYDSQSGTGFLAWRLKTVQRNTKLPFKETKMQTAGGGGPGQKRELLQIGGQLDEERCKEIISLMSHITDREIILQKMKDTFEYRQHLIHNPDESDNILSVFPRLLDTKGLINQDFNLIFGPETADKLLEKWHPSFKRKVIKEAESLTTSLLRSARNQNNDEASDCPEWDSDMASLLLLLHILPPQPSKKRRQKISAAQAMDHLVVFHKSCRSLEQHLESQEATCQPYLLAAGTSKQSINTYYVVIDKKVG
ncbi:uncharacterized protein LOC111670859 isoform X3 [Seriola lalandi dorsalis]|uniref:uncharacterized protein LOC111670859 isoform X3 n=1 Tax=Seriola lalandi dorsalis TaxID=1841481 RepID=UPI000C6F45A2|nr:uncharacterized protein LOC111670859 isoform X3 [Seriola lalandi dorsalis]